jgi:hypothetical protein
MKLIEKACDRFSSTMKLFLLVWFFSSALARLSEKESMQPEDQVFWDRFLRTGGGGGNSLNYDPTAAPIPNCRLGDVGVECCVTSDCANPTIEVCESKICIGKGNPRFTLTWTGDGTY